MPVERLLKSFEPFVRVTASNVFVTKWALPATVADPDWLTGSPALTDRLPLMTSSRSTLPTAVIERSAPPLIRFTSAFRSTRLSASRIRSASLTEPTAAFTVMVPGCVAISGGVLVSSVTSRPAASWALI
jgi:hypothetical protein